MAEIGISPVTLLRSLLVGGLAVAAARPLGTLLADHRRSVRRAAWILLLAPYFTPVLLTGYAYANFSLSLIHHPVLNVVFYSALLWWKFTPVAAVILQFLPAPISPEAVHCWRLNQPAARRHDRHPALAQVLRAQIKFSLFLLRSGCARGPLAAFAVVFLCAFGEFEMASLMVVKSWTVALFDAHAGGLALGESLRRMLAPLSCEAAAIAVAFLAAGRHPITPARPRPAGRGARGYAWGHLAVAAIVMLALPAALVLWGTLRGFGLLLENFVLGREILASLLFAAGGSVFALLAAFGLAAGIHRRGLPSLLARAGLIPALLAGLLGPLVLALTVLAAVQLPGLIWLRDTPVPLVFTLGLVLLPLALVLKWVLDLTRQRSALHLAGLMDQSAARRELLWRLSTGGKFWALLLLFVWAYWDLTASAILAPIGMTPVTVRLYNLMHYGQVATLWAMTCAAFAAPILIFSLAFGTRRWWAPP